MFILLIKTEPFDTARPTDPSNRALLCTVAWINRVENGAPFYCILCAIKLHFQSVLMLIS